MQPPAGSSSRSAFHTRVLRPLFSLSLFVLPYFVLTGCSLVGFAIGRAIDNGARSVTGPGALHTTARGTALEIVTRNGWTGSGTFDGFQDAASPGAGYREVYAALHLALPPSAWMPRIGDTVSLALSADRGERVVFQGISFGRIYFSAPPDAAVRFRSLSTVQSLAGRGGESISREDIARLLAESVLPAADTIVVRNEEAGAVPLPLWQVQEVKFVRPANTARWIGLGIGLVVDIALIAQASRHTSPDFFSGCGEAAGGCIRDETCQPDGTPDCSTDSRPARNREAGRVPSSNSREAARRALHHSLIIPLIPLPPFCPGPRLQ
jgi:hypothetical protein